MLSLISCCVALFVLSIVTASPKELQTKPKEAFVPRKYLLNGQNQTDY